MHQRLPESFRKQDTLMKFVEFFSFREDFGGKIKKIPNRRRGAVVVVVLVVVAAVPSCVLFFTFPLKILSILIS